MERSHSFLLIGMNSDCTSSMKDSIEDALERDHIWDALKPKHKVYLDFLELPFGAGLCKQLSTLNKSMVTRDRVFEVNKRENPLGAFS